MNRNAIRSFPGTITQRKAAGIIGCSSSTLAMMLGRGELQAVYLSPRRRRYLTSSVLKLLRMRSAAILAEREAACELFRDAVQRGAELERKFSNSETEPDSRLIELMWRCPRIMPADICLLLLLPAESPYSHGGRELRKWLAAQAAQRAA